MRNNVLYMYTYMYSSSNHLSTAYDNILMITYHWYYHGSIHKFAQPMTDGLILLHLSLVGHTHKMIPLLSILYISLCLYTRWKSKRLIQNSGPVNPSANCQTFSNFSSCFWKINDPFISNFYKESCDLGIKKISFVFQRSNLQIIV